MKHIRRPFKGFTLIETMVAISLLSIAIVAPMTLTAQSLASAYYARDQITAYYLAQEGIEAVRALRDGRILQIAENTGTSHLDLFGPIPVNEAFTIDARDSDPTQAIQTCSGSCPPLQTDGTFYGYEANDPNWTNTTFTRSLIACYIQSDGTCNSNETDEMRVTVTVSWQTGGIKPAPFSISEDLYRWVNDGTGAST